MTVLDGLGQPAAGASVTGTFSGDFSGTTSATPDTNDVAVLEIGPIKGRTNYSFCVDDVAHSSLTYDSSANVETCETY